MHNAYWLIDSGKKGSEIKRKGLEEKICGGKGKYMAKEGEKHKAGEEAWRAII